MLAAITTALFLALPLLISGCFHMLVVSRNWFPALASPIHLQAFGANKTWRGIVVMVVATIPGVYVMQWLEPLFGGTLLVSVLGVHPVLLGIALGLGYVVPELPNSYLKRRMNIKPGERSDKHTLAFSFLDQADSAIGCSMVYWLLLPVPAVVLLYMILLGPLVHVVANLSLYAFGLRKQPF